MTELAHAHTGRSNHTAHCGAVDFSWRVFFLRLFPENTAANVATFSRTKLRAAEYLIADESEPSGRALINLLRSPIGQRLLDALTADVDWRAIERRRLDIATIENELNELERKRRELVRVLDAPR